MGAQEGDGAVLGPICHLPPHNCARCFRVTTSKDGVRCFWSEAACGEGLLLPSLDAPGFAAQSAERYRLEPYIISFADFENARGLEVLEIGLGLGADHERFALG